MNVRYTTVFDMLFAVMQRESKSEIEITDFSFAQHHPLNLPGSQRQASYVKICAIRTQEGNIIKILFGSSKEVCKKIETIDYYTTSAQQKQDAIACLRMNKILPTRQDIINAIPVRESISSPDIVGMIQGDSVKYMTHFSH